MCDIARPRTPLKTTHQLTPARALQSTTTTPYPHTPIPSTTPHIPLHITRQLTPCQSSPHMVQPPTHQSHSYAHHPGPTTPTTHTSFNRVPHRGRTDTTTRYHTPLDTSHPHAFTTTPRTPYPTDTTRAIPNPPHPSYTCGTFKSTGSRDPIEHRASSLLSRTLFSFSFSLLLDYT